MLREHIKRQGRLVVWLAAWMGAICGCQPIGEQREPLPIAEVLPATEDLRERLDRTLQETLNSRRLSLEEHAAWQILHGVLAFGREFQVTRGGEPVSAAEHLLAGGSMRGWDVGPGIDLGEGRRGLQVELDLGSKVGQGHYDQWLSYLAGCGLVRSQTLRTADGRYTIDDWIRQVQWDVPRNLEREYSWTLVALTSYLPTNATWTASDGQEWSIERLLEFELEHDLAASACGGTHRLVGIATALNRHRADVGRLEGVWQRAHEKIAQAVTRARELQNQDGSFSTHYFARPGSSPDLAQNLGATGHTLEVLATAMGGEQLQEPWVRRAVVYLCEILDVTRDIPLECGALYHGVHGLVLYRERCFGPRTFLPAGRAEPPPASDPGSESTVGESAAYAETFFPTASATRRHFFMSASN